MLSDSIISDDVKSSSISSLHSKIDSVILFETKNKDDEINNKYLIEKLKPIRENFKKINSINDWNKIDTIQLWESTEGGEAYFYFKNKLEKITTRHFGETFQSLTEYYLFDNKLSFIYDKSYRYNRPFYYDSTKMKENNDNEIFNFEDSEIIETRYYFENEKLIHMINSQDCGSPFADDFLLEEQNSIMPYFNRLKKLQNQKK